MNLSKPSLQLTYLLIVIVVAFLCLGAKSNVYGEAIHMEINLNFGNHKLTPSTTVIDQQEINSKSSTSNTPIGSFSKPSQPASVSSYSIHESQPAANLIAEERKELFNEAKALIPESEAKDIADHYMKYANTLQQIYNSLPDNPHTKAMKQVLANYINELSKKASHPRADILQGSLTDITKQPTHNDDEIKDPISISKGIPNTELQSSLQSDSSGGSGSGGVATLFTESTPTNNEKLSKVIIQQMGSYSGGINMMGSSLSKIASQLSQMGYPEIARTTFQIGGNIQQFSKNKLSPLESNLARKIIPRIQTNRNSMSSNGFGNSANAIKKGVENYFSNNRRGGKLNETGFRSNNRNSLRNQKLRGSSSSNRNKTRFSKSSPIRRNSNPQTKRSTTIGRKVRRSSNPQIPFKTTPSPQRNIPKSPHNNSARLRGVSPPPSQAIRNQTPSSNGGDGNKKWWGSEPSYGFEMEGTSSKIFDYFSPSTNKEEHKPNIRK